ncbi:MAG: hypothetical protein ACR2PX_24065 [Endozoicomonas sp.]|uniref:hypothetical protein n=1 Tax=Endozoicomonas sp. TaxID=1892382 RepID=UPI003D9BD7D1
MGTTPESLVLTDVLWSIRYLAPYSCSNNGKISTTSAQEPVSNTPTSGSGCRSAWVSCLRFLFCCGGSGGGDDDGRNQWRIEERLRRQKNQDSMQTPAPGILSRQQSDGSRTSDSSDHRRRFPGLGRRARSANDVSRKTPSTEDLDKQLASIRNDLRRMSATNVDIQWQQFLLNQHCSEISQSLNTLPQNRPPSRVQFERIHSTTLGMGNIHEVAGDEDEITEL